MASRSCQLDHMFHIKPWLNMPQALQNVSYIQEKKLVCSTANSGFLIYSYIQPVLPAFGALRAQLFLRTSLYLDLEKCFNLACVQRLRVWRLYRQCMFIYRYGQLAWMTLVRNGNVKRVNKFFYEVQHSSCCIGSSRNGSDSRVHYYDEVIDFTVTRDRITFILS